MSRFRFGLSVGLWAILVIGVLAMFASVIVGAEEGPMTIFEVQRAKARGRMTLFGGGAAAVLAALGLYLIDRFDRPGGGKPKGSGWSSDLLD